MSTPCTKKRHRSPAAARKFVRLMASRRDEPMPRQYVYLCPTCNSWHVTRSAYRTSPSRLSEVPDED